MGETLKKRVFMARDKPREEFWEMAKDFVKWCTPEELRLIRVMAATEMENRLRGWDERLAISESEAKSRKSKAIQRNIRKQSK